MSLSNAPSNTITHTKTINNFETASRVQLQGLIVTDVPEIPTQRLRALLVVIIFVRAGWRANTVSCSLLHCHDHGNRFTGQTVFYLYTDDDDNKIIISAVRTSISFIIIFIPSFFLFLFSF